MISNCDACKMRNITVEQLRIDGQDVLVCVNWQACIKRFSTKEDTDPIARVEL